MEILKYLFTPEEALIASNLKFSWSRDFEQLDAIYKRLKDIGMSIEEVEQHLDKMAEKGLIHFKIDDNVKYYANAQFIIGIYEFQVNKLDEEFLKKFFKYIRDNLGIEIFGTKISQFRTIPVEKSLTPEHNVPTYDELKTIIETAEEPFVATNCVCRQATKIVGHSCKVTERMEVCMGFGPMAHMYIEQGWGREITREEALELQRKNEEDGLVLQAGNSLRPHFICSCCGCCCPVLRGTRRFPRPVQFFSANFTAEVDEELCSGCETCLSRCQRQAIKIVNDVSKVNWKKCIGCGNCVPTCPEEAIQLKKKDKEIDPYPTMDEMYDGILEKKLELKAKKK
jgi:NAD-dependent dihydropyrimidine dehydrogenase PreA subunit/DNA-binding transcriptional ArsR family regulator